MEKKDYNPPKIILLLGLFIGLSLTLLAPAVFAQTGIPYRTQTTIKVGPINITSPINLPKITTPIVTIKTTLPTTPGPPSPTIDPDTVFYGYFDPKGDPTHPTLPGTPTGGTPGLPPGVIPPADLKYDSTFSTDPAIIELYLPGKGYNIIYFTSVGGPGGSGVYAKGDNFSGGGFGLNFGGIIPPIVTNNEFKVAILPKLQTISAGETTTYDVTVTALEDFEGDVTLSENLNDPANGITASFSTSTVSIAPNSPAISLLTANTLVTTKGDNYNFSVVGTSGNLAGSDLATLEILKGLKLEDPDLIITSLQFFPDDDYENPAQSFEPSGNMYVQVQITNVGTNIKDTFNTAFYLNLQARPNDDCQNNPQTTSTISLNKLNWGKTFTWQFQTTAPDTWGIPTAYAFADSNCQISEFAETNNIKSNTYSIQAGGLGEDGPAKTKWLQTLDGNVGTAGSISMSQNPPKNLSSFLLAARDVGNSQGIWQLNNYAKPLISQGSVYGYFASRFKGKAQSSGKDCNFAGALDSFYYCGDSTNLTINSTTPKPQQSAVVFVDGNLTFDSNYQIGVASIVFIVSGDITVNSQITTVDGVLIAGGQFADCQAADPGCGDGQTLEINGSVYAKSLSLPRALEDGNDLNPALLINYQPKYLEAMSTILGSPTMLWQEVAP